MSNELVPYEEDIPDAKVLPRQGQFNWYGRPTIRPDMIIVDDIEEERPTHRADAITYLAQVIEDSILYGTHRGDK